MFLGNLKIDYSGRDLILTVRPYRGERAKPYLDVILKYGSWEDGLEIHRWEDGKWELEKNDPDIRLLFQERDKGGNVTTCSLIPDIPENIKNVFVRYDYLQTPLLQWVARNAKAKDLLDMPVLLWMILDMLSKKPKLCAEDVERLLADRRIKILEFLFNNNGIRFTQKDLNFIRHISLLSRTREELCVIKNALYLKEMAERLVHLQKIPVHLVSILLRNPDFYDTSLLKKIAKVEYADLSSAMSHLVPFSLLFDTAFRTGRVLFGSHNAMKALKDCPDMTAVRKLHGRWVSRFNEKQRKASQKPFPPPLVPGNDCIIPLRNEDEIIKEGDEMNHCVAQEGFVRAIRAGISSIYKVIDPQRATLQINRNSNSQIYVAQFKLSHNREPSAESWKAVQRWLNDHGGFVK